MGKVTVKRVDKKYEKKKDIKNLMEYIIRDKIQEGNVVEYWGTRGTLKDIKNAYEQIVTVQKCIRKETGRRMNHIIVSFAEEVKNKQAIYEIAELLADHMGQEYQLIYGVHTDTDNWHIHYAVSAVSYRDSKKWHKNIREFEAWKQELTEIANNQLIQYGF